MKHRASLTCVVVVLVTQLVLGSAVPVLAVRAPPAVTAPPALGLSDLAIAAPNEPSPDYALPAYTGVAVPETASRHVPTPIGPWPSAQQSESPAAVRILQEVSNKKKKG